MIRADAPPCPDCGTIMVRNRGQYSCLNCGRDNVSYMHAGKLHIHKLGKTIPVKELVKRIATAEEFKHVFDTCPVCGAELIIEKSKVVCRSEKCVHRLIYSCSES